MDSERLFGLGGGNVNLPRNAVGNGRYSLTVTATEVFGSSSYSVNGWAVAGLRFIYYWLLELHINFRCQFQVRHVWKKSKFISLKQDAPKTWLCPLGRQDDPSANGSCGWPSSTTIVPGLGSLVLPHWSFGRTLVRLMRGRPCLSRQDLLRMFHAVPWYVLRICTHFKMFSK